MSDTSDESAQQTASTFDFSGVPETTRDLQNTADWFGLPDHQLQQMSHWANQMQEGIGVTLVVSGGAISGTVVSAGNFFTGLSAELQEVIDNQDNGTQYNAAKEYVDTFFNEPAKACADQSQADIQAFRDGKLAEPRFMMTRYVHLKDARYLGTGTSSIPLGYTRVLLSHVSAWTVGQQLV